MAAAALSFDDLIPASPPAPAAAAPKAALSFDDLIPASAPAQPAQFSSGDDDPYAAAARGDAATWVDTKSAIANTPQRADDFVRLLANGATFGGADKIAGATISSPEQEAARTAGAKERTGGAGQIAGLAGAVAPAVALGGVVGAGARAVEGVPALGRLFANPVVQGTATGAGMGATDAAVHGQDVAGGAMLGAAGGAGGAALGSAIGAGARGLGSLFSEAPQVPSSQALQAAARQSYADAENAGVVYSPEAMDRLRGAVQDHMADFGYAPELQPGGAAVLRSLDRSDGMPTTLQGVDITRRIAGRMAETSPSSAALGGGLKGVIDDFTANARPGDVMMGDAQGGAEALARARQLYQRSSKDQDLSDALGRAQLRAGSTGSGGNVNNATRQQVRGVLEGRQDWTPDEQDALTRVILGSQAGNAARQVGKLSPEGNGLMQALNLGAVATQGPQALAFPIVGAIAKRYADRATAQAVDDAGRLIRMGGDRAALQAPPNALQRIGGAVPAPLTNLSLGALYAPPEVR